MTRGGVCLVTLGCGSTMWYRQVLLYLINQVVVIVTSDINTLSARKMHGPCQCLDKLESNDLQVYDVSLLNLVSW